MFSLKVIKLDELSNKYLWFFLNKIAIGFVSYTFIITVFGYLFFTSIFSKKLISCKGLSISDFFMKKIFFILSVFITSILVAEDNTVVTRMVVGDDPRAGVIHVLCIEDYKFAIYQNSRVVRTCLLYTSTSPRD